MSIRQRIAGLIAGPSEVLARNVEPSFPAPSIVNQVPITEFTRGSDAWNDMFGPTRGLPVPTRSTAMTSSAIYACTSLIAGAIMAMPVNIYKVSLEDGERDLTFNDDLHWVLNEEMSPRWSSASGWEYLVSSLLFEGDAFAPIIRDRMSRPIGLEPVHPDRVTVGVTADGLRLAYEVMPEIIGGHSVGKRRVLDQDDMIHVPGFGFDGRRGLSPLRHSLRTAGAVAIATQDYAANFFANSARPDYALKTDKNLDAKVIQEYKDEIDARHRSPENAHRPMVLHSGLDIKTWSISASDMQLLATRQFQIEEIARVYGVPPFMIGHMEKSSSWASSTEAMGKGFVRYGLRQHLHKFEVEINRKLFRTATRAAEFDTSDLERADFKTLMESLRAGVGRAGEPGIMRVNEARRILRLKKDPKGNELGINPGKPSSEPKPQEEPAA